MCMTFGCNPQIFCHFFHSLNVVIFKVYINTGYLVNATPLTVLPRSF